MLCTADQHITQLLSDAAEGQAHAAAELLPIVYHELRILARRQLMRIPPGNTLQPTALVHEAYVKLIGDEDPGWNGRGHFFGAAANAMRQILVDQARRKGALKHGGDRRRISLDDAEPAIALDDADLLALEDALVLLEKADPRKGQIVMLRFFAGLTAAETAAALDISIPTVDREWRFIRSFLHTRMRPQAASNAPAQERLRWTA